MTFAPASGAPGTAVVLQGSGLASAVQVTFGGVAAQFQVNGNNQLTALVPVGAATGVISVATSGGIFTVTAPAS